MEQRIVEFIAGLRAAGIRISIAESEDAFRATEHMGVRDRRDFQDALRATLVKEARDRSTFDELFPLYFGSDGPPLTDLREDLSPDQRNMLAQALQALLQQLRQANRRHGKRRGKDESSDWNVSSSEIDALMQLLSWLLQGTGPTPEELDAAAQEAGFANAKEWYEQRWVQNRMMRQMGMQYLDQLMAALSQMLAEMGMSQRAIDQLMEGMEANRQALAERIAQHLGVSAARKRAEASPQPRSDVADLMHRPFQNLSEREADLLRDQVRRLAAQLRSRAALRRKRGKRGTLDVKKIVRANLRYGGVPLELKFRTRHLKPKLLLVCDVSTSMRPVVEFLLRLIYELHDQVAAAHSFAFIDDLSDITPDFAQYPPDVAIEMVLTRLPPGHYNTDLGHSLDTLLNKHGSRVDPRTTVIFVGDARNNYNDPRLDLMEQIQRRARRVIWLNPEHPAEWGSGDSDMRAYLPYASAVHRVSNLAELTTAVDKLLTTR
jgi:uncharacterized protein with von Willebrand factor type A (vWA) domain